MQAVRAGHARAAGVQHLAPGFPGGPSQVQKAKSTLPALASVLRASPALETLDVLGRLLDSPDTPDQERAQLAMPSPAHGPRS